ncbi:GNAT family N-acetyltransferase [Bacillus salitolerans]|uniref:GNAT family N-acetyltransferase n=1 Tax=Bacillus salitolerans TaxID=1437434 RepID=A0ABW4LSD5_9BACI
MSFFIRKGTRIDLQGIDELVKLVKENLLEQHIFQWDDNYPNKEYLEHCIHEGDLYVLEDDQDIKGIVVLNEWQSQEWESIHWTEGSPLVIHTLCIHPKDQGKGIGKQLLLFCEDYAKKNEYDHIRLDAFAGNKTALGLYEKYGYEYRGDVQFDFKPVGHETYRCYEKALGGKVFIGKSSDKTVEVADKK